ncbi:hypothetical protein FRC03_009936 [Tulasnella sp. 419]|nr:hypothetical protein FRC03_009936 [Tulasnella sp. 419]
MGSQQSTTNDDASGFTQQFPSLLHFYHALSKSFSKGSSTPGHRRPGLPTELIIMIFRMAGLKHPNYSESTLEPLHFKPTHSETYPREWKVQSWDARRAEQCWIITDPLDEKTLYKTASIQLYTWSRDQGWVNDRSQGSWSWFEIGIASEPLTNDDNSTPTSAQIFDGLNVVQKLRPDSKEPLRWRSHSNVLAARNIQEHAGEVFDYHHELWSFIKAGDRLCVYMCAQFGGWSNIAIYGRIRVWKYFEPTLL